MFLDSLFLPPSDTFTDGVHRYAMTSIKVPEPVMSLALTPKSAEQMGNFMKALTRFQKEDPTFRVSGKGLAGGGHEREGGRRQGAETGEARASLHLALSSALSPP